MSASDTSPLMDAVRSGDGLAAAQLEAWQNAISSDPLQVFQACDAWLTAHPESSDRSTVRRICGIAAARISRNQRAIELLEAVLPDLPAADDAARALERCTVLRSLGSARGETGDPGSAGQLYTEAFELARQFGLLREQAACHNNLANLLQAGGDYAKAVEHYRSGLDLFRQLGEPGAILIMLSNIAAVLRCLGDDAAALDYLLESAAMAQDCGDQRGHAIALHNAADILIQLQRTAEAEQMLRESIHAFTQQGTAAEALLARCSLARICFDCGKQPEADRLLVEIRKDLQTGPQDDERLFVGAVAEFCALLARYGSPSAVERDHWLEIAIAHAGKLGLRAELIQLLESRADIAESAGNNGLAVSLLRQILKVERDWVVQRSEEALRKQQAALEVDRLRDLTERERRHNRELAAVNQDLARSRDEAARQAELARHASAAKGRFLSVMSHELRTPVNAIHGCARLLTQALPDSRRKACLEVISSASESLLTLVNHQLDLAKIEAGKVQVESRPFDMAKELRAALLAVAPAAAAKGLLLLPEIAPDVPASPVGDGFRLRQILINLLANAVRFTQQGTVVLRVKFFPARQLWRFCVRDTGPGMDPSQLSSIFDAFQQGDNQIEAIYGGTGLGLTICDQLATLLGGKLSAASRVHQGTTFTLQVPMPVHDSLPDPDPDHSTDSSHQLPDCVRLVISNPAIRDWVGRILRQACIRVAASDDAMAPLFATADDLASVNAPCIGAGVRLLLLDPVAYANHGEVCDDPCATRLPLPLLPGDLLAALVEDSNGGDDAPLGGPGFAAEHPLRILIVEDDPASRTMMAELLAHLGYQPLTAANGAVALELCQQQAFDLIITDLHMPKLDGEALATALRSDPRLRNVRVIAASATRQIADLDRASFDGFLHKPILPEQLMQMLRSTAGDWSRASDSAVDSPPDPRPNDHSTFVDRQHWQRLRVFLSAGRARELMSTALADIAKILDQLNAIVALQEDPQLPPTLHRITGIAAHYGLRALEEAASRLESDCGNGDRPDSLLRDLQSLRNIHVLTQQQAASMNLCTSPHA